MASQKWIMLFGFLALFTLKVEARTSLSCLVELISQLNQTIARLKNCSCDAMSPVIEEEDDLLTEMRKSIQQKDSLQRAINLFDDWIHQSSNESTGSSTKTTQQEKMSEAFHASNALEQFVLEFAQYHLNPTTPQIRINSTKADLQLRKIFHQNESEFLLQEIKGQNFVQIPPENFHNGSVVLGAIYKDLHKVFLTYHSDTQTKNKTRHLNTNIMSARITPGPAALKENITLTFRNLEAATLKRDCVSLIMSENSGFNWSEQGCHVKSMEDTQTECSCSHLTHFAVLMQFYTDTDCDYYTTSETDHTALDILAVLGMSLSLIGIILTILCYVFLTDMESPLSQIRVCLVASLGAGQIVLLAGSNATHNKAACVAVAALVQYFLMAAFCWMLFEGIYLYLFVVQVYNVSEKLNICHWVSWGVPALAVALSLSTAAGIEGIETFVSDEYCWMSSANNLIWIFILFVVVIALLNILILIRVVKEMTNMQQTKDSKTEQIRFGIKACVLLVPLLGLTWLFGLLSPLHIAFAYIFTIFNSTQGFFIFLLHCVRNTEIRRRFKRKVSRFIDDEASIKTSFATNYSTSEDASEKSNRNNKLGDSTGGNAPLKKTKVNPSSKKSKLDDSKGGIASPKKNEVNPSNGNSKSDDSEDSNAPLKKIKSLLIYYYCKYFK